MATPATNPVTRRWISARSGFSRHMPTMTGSVEMMKVPTAFQDPAPAAVALIPPIEKIKTTASPQSSRGLLDEPRQTPGTSVSPRTAVGITAETGIGPATFTPLATDAARTTAMVLTPARLGSRAFVMTQLTAKATAMAIVSSATLEP